MRKLRTNSSTSVTVLSWCATRPMRTISFHSRSSHWGRFTIPASSITKVCWDCGFAGLVGWWMGCLFVFALSLCNLNCITLKSVCVCVCVREGVCVSVHERERERVCVCMYVHVCMHACVCLFMCVKLIDTYFLTISQYNKQNGKKLPKNESLLEERQRKVISRDTLFGFD